MCDDRSFGALQRLSLVRNPEGYQHSDPASPSCPHGGRDHVGKLRLSGYRSKTPRPPKLTHLRHARKWSADGRCAGLQQHGAFYQICLFPTAYGIGRKTKIAAFESNHPARAATKSWSSVGTNSDVRAPLAVGTRPTGANPLVLRCKTSTRPSPQLM